MSEILHFTTDKGVLGSLRKDEVLSRKRVQDDPDLAFIFLGVWPRKDHAWVDYVSLSVHSINRPLYAAAVRNLPDRWWAVVSFVPDILDHDDVWFATTNNIYPSCLRAKGIEGFEAIYADPVFGRYSARHTRQGLPPAQPTDRAAEVLYPRGLALEHVQAIYVGTDQHRRMVRAWCSALDREEAPVQVRPEIFS